MDNKPWKLSVEKTQVGLQPQKIPFKYLGKQLQIKMQTFFQRKITMREVVIKIIGMYCKMGYYIPNKEFNEMVQSENGLKFWNVSVLPNGVNGGNGSYYIVKENGTQSIDRKISMAKQSEGNNKIYQSKKTHSWYHGTRVPAVKHLSDLKPDLCSPKGDFGQGVYFANMLKVSKEYVKNNHSGKIFEGVWFNDELEQVYKDIKKHSYPYLEILHDNSENRKEIKVVIFPKKDRGWAEAILKGWMGQRVKWKENDVDMVIGPLSHNSTIATLPQYTKDFDLKSLQEQEQIIDRFDRESTALQYGNRIPLQMCCYQDRVISCFVQKRCI